MASIASELQQLKQEFASLPDGFARYSYLTELSPAPRPGRCVRTGTATGAVNQVWLHATAEKGLCHLEADSDTLIIRGILALFRELLEGRPVPEVLEARFDLLKSWSSPSISPPPAPPGWRVCCRNSSGGWQKPWGAEAFPPPGTWATPGTKDKTTVPQLWARWF